jgi:hypothetical protein
MKYYVSTTPGPMPPSPDQFDAAVRWLESRASDGTFDCIFGFMEGGGFAITNANSHSEILDLMMEYPLYGLVTWDVRPLLDWKEGTEKTRAKLVETQAAFAAH